MQPPEVLARRAEAEAAGVSSSPIEVPRPPQTPGPAPSGSVPAGSGAAPAEGAESSGQTSPAGEAQRDDATILTLAEAARTVGLSERALRKHILRGKLVSQRIVRNGRQIAAVTVGDMRATYGKLEMVPTPGASGDATRLQSARELQQAEALVRLRAEQRDAEARLVRLRAILGMERTEKRELRRQMRFLAETLTRTEARLEASQAEMQRLSEELGHARGRAEALDRILGGASPAPDSEPST